MPDAPTPAPAPTAQPPTPQPVGNAPAAAGMMTPQPAGGEVEAAKLDVYHAQKLLERAIAKFGPKSEDGNAALRILGSLIKRFGENEDTSEEFSPSELKRMVAALAGPGAAGPGAPPPPQGAPPGGAPPPGQ